MRRVRGQGATAGCVIRMCAFAAFAGEADPAEICSCRLLFGSVARRRLVVSCDYDGDVVFRGDGDAQRPGAHDARSMPGPTLGDCGEDMLCRDGEGLVAYANARVVSQEADSQTSGQIRHLGSSLRMNSQGHVIQVH